MPRQGSDFMHQVAGSGMQKPRVSLPDV